MDMSNNKAWLTILRGAIEKSIDKLLSDEVMSSSRKLFENMPTIKNSDDAIFGYVFGYVSGVMDMTFANLDRQPSDEDINEIATAITNRMQEIKNRICETKT